MWLELLLWCVSTLELKAAYMRVLQIVAIKDRFESVHHDLITLIRKYVRRVACHRDGCEAEHMPSRPRRFPHAVVFVVNLRGDEAINQL